MTRRGRLVLGVLGTVATLVGVMSWAAPAMAASEPILAAHQCRVIGDDGVHEAVSCADLWVLNYADPFGAREVWAEAEVLCQTKARPAVTLQCAGIHETAGLCSYSLNPGPCLIANPTLPVLCGQRFGVSPCPSSGQRFTTKSPVYFVNATESINFWGDSLNAEVVLPGSGLPVGGPGTNEATRHVDICVTAAGDPCFYI